MRRRLAFLEVQAMRCYTSWAGSAAIELSRVFQSAERGCRTTGWGRGATIGPSAVANSMGDMVRWLARPCRLWRTCLQSVAARAAEGPSC